MIEPKTQEINILNQILLKYGKAVLGMNGLTIRYLISGLDIPDIMYYSIGEKRLINITISSIFSYDVTPIVYDDNHILYGNTYYDSFGLIGSYTGKINRITTHYNTIENKDDLFNAIAEKYPI